MENYSLKDEIIKNLEERQDARKKFNRTQPVIAACRTRDSNFEAFIQNISSSGVFIKTTKNLLAGQEIAMTFTFPKTQKTIMATGEIVRISNDGAGVKFKIFFKRLRHYRCQLIAQIYPQISQITQISKAQG